MCRGVKCQPQPRGAEEAARVLGKVHPGIKTRFVTEPHLPGGLSPALLGGSLCPPGPGCSSKGRRRGPACVPSVPLSSLPLLVSLGTGLVPGKATGWVQREAVSTGRCPPVRASAREPSPEGSCPSGDTNPRRVKYPSHALRSARLTSY